MTRLLIAVLPALVFAANAVAQDFLQLTDADAQPLAKLMDAFRKPESLYYESDYKWTWTYEGEEFVSDFWYRCWLKKPDLFRVEIMEADSDDVKGVLVGSRSRSWFYWPNGRPMFQWEDRGEFSKAYEKNKFTSFKRMENARSISHEMMHVGGMFLTVLDPSTFHGHRDSALDILDGVKRVGDEAVNGLDCQVVEASFGLGQESWRVAVSKADSIPRKLTAKRDSDRKMTVDETWSNIAVDIEIPNSKFNWKPPAGWTELREPPIEAGFLRPGEEAPDFKMKSLEGIKVKLSDFRSKNVWLFKWRIG